MIVIPSKQLLILTPPHTGSRVLHHVLCTQVPGAIWCNGTTPDGLIQDQHTMMICPEFKFFTRYLIIRNPYERIFALWQHLVEWCRYNGDGCCSFKDFVKLVHEDCSERLSYMYRYTITRLLGDTEYQSTIDYPDLRVQIKSLFGVAIPEQPDKWRRELASYYDENTLKLVEEWANHDIVKWGYSKP